MTEYQPLLDDRHQAGLAPQVAEQPSQSTWHLFMVAWFICGAVSVALAAVHQYVAAVCVAAPVTMVGMLWKPLFGLSFMFAMLTVGTLGSGEFSIGRGIAIVFAVSLIANAIFTGRKFYFNDPNVWALLAITLLASLALMWSPYPAYSAVQTFTMFQLLVFAALTVTVCRSGSLLQIQWILRAYVLGTLATIAAARAMGIQFDQMEGKTERFTIAISSQNTVNPNQMGVMFGLAFFCAVYLFFRDPHRKLRLLWLVAMFVLPVMSAMTASRKALFGLFLTLGLGLLFVREIIRRPGILIGVLLVVLIVAGALAIGLEHFLPDAVVNRLTSKDYAEHSAGVRFNYMHETLDYVVKNPMGASFSCFFTSDGNVVHNDLFFLLGSLGWAGGILFVTYAIAVVLKVKRMSAGWEKWLARSFVIYLLMMGLAAPQVNLKHLWFFMTMATMLSAVEQKERQQQYLLGGEPIS